MVRVQIPCFYGGMNLTFIACATDGLQRVDSPIQISGGGTVTASSNYMSCPKCHQTSRLIDFSFETDKLGKETVNYLLTPDVVAALSKLKLVAQRVTFQELNSLYEFYSQDEAALEYAPPTIRGFFAALKGQNAMAITTYLSLLLAILPLTGMIGSPELSPEEIVEIVREYDATHPEPIQNGFAPPSPDIAPEMIDPPENIES